MRPRCGPHGRLRPGLDAVDLRVLTRLQDALVPVVRAAGDLVMAVYAGPFDVAEKRDERGNASPVTLADRQSEALITRALHALSPDIPVVGEEAASEGAVPTPGERFWLVDPLDGTREFVGRNGEFTVNVALIERGEAQLGLVLAPAIGRLYAGVVGHGAWLECAGVRRPIRCRAVPDEGLTVLASRSHGDERKLQTFLAGRRVARIVSAGSSLKLALLAQGEADVYPRFGRTMEWDIAAGHAVVAAAGGRVECLDGTPLAYGKPGFENPHFVAWGRPPTDAAD